MTPWICPKCETIYLDREQEKCDTCGYKNDE